VSGVYVTRRRTRTGAARWIVRFRVGGRATALTHAGSFPTLREAKIRRDFVGGELAAGRHPGDALAAMRAAAEKPPAATLREWGDRWLASRLDVDPTTAATYRSATRAIVEGFGANADPAAVAAGDVADWVGRLAEQRSPATCALYLNVARQLFDFAGVEERNPARDRRVRLPKRKREEPLAPLREHTLAILDRVPDGFVLPLVAIEQGGLRVGELVSLTWGDVDAAGSRLRLPGARTKSGQPRWVSLPLWLTEAIEQTCPLEDRVPERRVFAGLTDTQLRTAMRRACTLAKIPNYTPHSFRHRRATRWHHDGVPARELAERVGHANPTLTLNLYSHALDDGEVPEEQLRALITAVRAARP